MEFDHSDLEFWLQFGLERGLVADVNCDHGCTGAERGD